jgi:hypothetical protein
MRNLRLFSIVLLISFFKAEAKKIEGQIIYDNDTVNVYFKIPVGLFAGELHYERLQYRVSYFDMMGNRFVLLPDQAKEIRFVYDDKNIRMLSRSITMNSGIFSSGRKIFLKLEIDGYLKLFTYYYTQSSPGTYNSSTGTTTGSYSYTVEKYVLQKGGGELMWPRRHAFKKDMTTYFIECPELTEKIENGDFKKVDMELIVTFYNMYCR